MRHDYYYYSREELLKAPKLPIEILSDNQAVFQAIAQEMADEIKRKNALGERTVFICPVGPVGQYPYFVDTVNQENISLKNVWFLNMDEYLTDDLEWIDHEHPLSFRGFMDRTVYSKIWAAWTSASAASGSTGTWPLTRRRTNCLQSSLRRSIPEC